MRAFFIKQIYSYIKKDWVAPLGVNDGGKENQHILVNLVLAAACLN
jgi:hypothetical protein